MIVVRLTADRPGSLTLRVQLRGERNTAHSNYATDYFRMDGDGADGLRVRGRSADYMGVPGRVRYEAATSRDPRGGRHDGVRGDALLIDGADRVLAAHGRGDELRVLQGRERGSGAARRRGAGEGVRGKSFDELRAAHVAEHHRLFGRVALSLRETPTRVCPPMIG